METDHGWPAPDHGGNLYRLSKKPAARVSAPELPATLRRIENRGVTATAWRRRRVIALPVGKGGKNVCHDGPKNMRLLIRSGTQSTEIRELALETLTTLLQKAKGIPIEYDGRRVQGIFRTAVERGERKISVQRVKSKGEPTQGLRVEVVKGVAVVNGQQLTETILWSDTAPRNVDIVILAKSGCELKAWNVWRMDHLTQAWIGNAGMVVRDNDASIMLACSDGIGGVDFSDLVVELRIG